MKSITLLSTLGLGLSLVACSGTGAQEFEEDEWPTTDPTSQEEEREGQSSETGTDESNDPTSEPGSDPRDEESSDPTSGSNEEETEPGEEPTEEEREEAERREAEREAVPGRIDVELKPILIDAPVIETKFDHPLPEPDSTDYCGEDYDVSCASMKRSCSHAGDDFVCLLSDAETMECIWGMCREAPLVIGYDDGSPSSSPHPDKIDSGNTTQAMCSSCSAICQTVSWVNGQSSYEEIDLGGGMSPSDCADQGAAVCGAGLARYLLESHCGW